jgi:soluble lytic murein transglycosylase
MMMSRFLARLIPVLWFSLTALAWFPSAAPASPTSSAHHKKSHHKKSHAHRPSAKTARKTARSRRPARIVPPKAPRIVTAGAGTLAALGQAYALKPTSASAAALKHYAATHPGTAAEGEANLALAAIAFRQAEWDNIPAYTQKVRELLPALADYAAYYLAGSQLAHHRLDDANQTLAPVWSQSPASPFIGPATLLLARAYLDSHQPEKALAILDAHAAEIPPSALAFLRAEAFDALGQPTEASRLYQTVFYDFPLSPDAPAAAQALARLKKLPGHPSPTAAQILGRAEKLLDAGQPLAAQRFLEDSLGQLDRPGREMAQVDIGAALLANHDDRKAYSHLQSLDLSTDDAAAARLYYLSRAASRLDRVPDAQRAVDELSRQFPKSPWRQRALIALGNRFLTENDPDSYIPLYRACFESFPGSDGAAYCNWKFVWTQYLANPSSAESGLRNHLLSYPHSPKANAALYFLARIAESRRESSRAASLYRSLTSWYPNSYYAILARSRLSSLTLPSAPPPPSLSGFLESLPRPPLPPSTDFQPNPLTKARIARAQILATAGLDSEAESELKFGASHDRQPQIAALELASLASSRNAADQAIRYIKHYVPGYLNLPLNQAPTRFWQLAFPLPYRTALFRYSSEHSLDPYLVAALIRQESEFNPRAISSSKALGLTQVVPSTGKYLSRRAGVPRFRTALLFQPETNLRIGTYYLRTLLDNLHGSAEAALASYNAGESRAQLWLSWHTYREPAEFVETIPFSQTRDYVEIVLHNADVYRRLYENVNKLHPEDDSTDSATNTF